MFPNPLQIFLSQLGTVVGVFCLALALNPVPHQNMSKPPPYMNTSICLAKVPATAVIDEQGNRVAVGWPSPIPTVLPATAPCFPLRDTIATTSGDGSAPLSGTLQGAVATNVNKRPGGMYYCEFANWGNPCYYHSFSPADFGHCWEIEDFENFDNCLALGPDYGTVLDLYWDNGCKKLAMNDVVYPGFANLSRIGLDKKMRSMYVKHRSQIGQAV